MLQSLKVLRLAILVTFSPDWNDKLTEYGWEGILQTFLN